MASCIAEGEQLGGSAQYAASTVLFGRYLSSSVVLPEPAGATSSRNGTAMCVASRRSERERRTVEGAKRGSERVRIISLLYVSALTRGSVNARLPCTCLANRCNRVKAERAALARRPKTAGCGVR